MIACLIALLWPFAAQVPPDTVVARATKGEQTITITAARLAAYAAEHPERSPRALAEELIEFELLAAEARRQQLTAEPTVQAAVARAMVRRYLIADFEPQWDPAKLPEHYVRRSYEQNIRRYVRPPLRVGDHLLLTQKNNTRPSDAALDAEAKALMETVRADLTADPPADRLAFMDRAKRFASQAEALGLTLRAEALGRFQREGQFVEPFGAQMFAVPEAGGLTPAFATRFGWHIGRVEAIEAAVNRPYAEVADALRARIAPEVRVFEFGRLVQDLGRAAGAMIDFGPLERLSKRQGLDEGQPTP